MRVLIAALLLCAFMAPFAAAQPCNTAADADCDGLVNINEITGYINTWYSCSACCPELLGALNAYLGGPAGRPSGCDAGFVCRYGECVEEEESPGDYAGYWTFDTDARDGTGRNNGSFIGDARIGYDAERDNRMGTNGNVLMLDGAGDSFHVNERNPLNFTNDFTVLAWIKKRGARMEEIVTRSHGSSAIGYYLHWNGNMFRVDANTGSWTCYNGIGRGLLAGTWQHVAFVFNSSNDMLFYLDGNLNAVRHANGPVAYDGSSFLHIGGSWSGSLWNGSIDDVMIYNRSLSQREIEQIYDTQSARKWPSPSGTYYVSNSGNDGNPGTFDEPFATIEKARDTIRWTCENGVTTYLMGGTYYLNRTLEFDAQDSGAPGEPNTYRAYGNDEVIIKGSVRVPASAFRPYSGSVLAANLSPYSLPPFYQLIHNGKRQIPARYPNFNASDPYFGGWLFADASSTAGSLYYKEGDIDPAGWDLKYAWVDIFGGPNYGNFITKINSMSPPQRLISTAGGQTGPGNRYYVGNVLQELDAPGEWYYDNDTKMLYFYPETALKGTDEITIPVAINTISFDGADYMSLEGIDVQESWARGTTPLHAYDRGNCVNIENSGFVTIDGSNITNCGMRGFFIADSMNITVRNSEISHTGREAVHAEDGDSHFKSLTNTGYLVTNNTIHDTNDIEIIWSGAILSETVGSTYSYNRFYDLPRISVLLYCSNDNVVEYNEVRNVNLETEDTGSLYFIGCRSLNRGNVFRSNFVNGSGGLCQYGGRLYYPCYSYGIYIDNAGSGTGIFNNTIVGTNGAAVLINGGRDNRIEGNTIVENRNSQQILFGGSWGNATAWYQELQAMEAEGYDKALYLQKYPELLTIRPGLTGDEVIGYNTIKGNVFIYPESATHLYNAGAFDLATNDIGGNVIWQGLDPIVIGIKALSWDQWKASGHDDDSAMISDIFQASIYDEDFSDDYKLIVNSEHDGKGYVLNPAMCGLDGSIIDSVMLGPFESRILLACFCNSDRVCNNRETLSTCPGDCTQSCSDGAKDQDETGVDCGGIVCDGCGEGGPCMLDYDCASRNCVGGSCQSASFPTDYVSYWKLDAEEDRETIDETRRNPVILSNNATIADDPERGKVLAMDGSGDEAKVIERAPLGFPNDFTVSAWFRKKGTRLEEIVTRNRGGGSAIGYYLEWNGNRFRVDANTGSWTIYNGIGSGLVTDKWQHVAFVFNRSNDMAFYVDGTLNAVRHANGPIVYDGLCATRIGGSWSGSIWNGSIDDVMIYNRSLSSSEVRQIYEAQR